MHPVVDQYLPLAAWIALLLATSLITWTVYKLTARHGGHDAKVQGQLGTLAVTFGGPIALFVALAWIGKSYIPDETLVRLEGELTDIHNAPVAEASIIPAAYAEITDSKGRFSIDVPRSRNRQYDIAALGARGGRIFSVGATDANEVKIQDFPDPNNTIVLGQQLKDTAGNLIEGPVKVFVRPIADPQGGVYQPGGQIKINIDRQKYMLVLTDTDGKKLASKEIDVNSGHRFELITGFALNGE